MLSRFHKHVGHASTRLFVQDLKQARAFYEQLGFVLVYPVTGAWEYLRMGQVYIELWRDQVGLTRTALQDADGHVYQNPSLVISLRGLDALNAMAQAFKAEGLTLDEKEICNDSSPWGENFRVTDPDGNLIVFRSVRPMDNTVPYEKLCCELLDSH